MEKQQLALDLHEGDASIADQTKNPTQIAGLRGFFVSYI